MEDRPAFDDWMLNYRSLLRLSEPLPISWRHLIWKGQSADYFRSIDLDRESRFPDLFSDQLTEDDKLMDYQIVKDLHRTANIGSNEEQQRLKRILLAYARYNTDCGYCQGFNVIVGLGFNTDGLYDLSLTDCFRQSLNNLYNFSDFLRFFRK